MRLSRTWALMLLLLSLCGSGTADARLGETLEECIARYGPVIATAEPRLPESDEEACKFSKGGISLVIEFREGVAWNLRYRSPNLLPNLVTELLKANMLPGGSWSKALIVEEVHYRISGDRQRTAAYYPMPAGQSSMLEVSDQNFNQKWAALRAAEIDELLSGPSATSAKEVLEGF